MTDKFISPEKPIKNRTTNIGPPVSILDSMDHPYFAQRNFVLSLLANVAAFVVFLFVPKTIRHFDENFDFAEFAFITYTASLLLPFISGFLIGYAAASLFRIYRSSKTSARLKIDTGLMSGYRRSQEQSEIWIIWLFATTCGVINLAVFTFALEAIKRLF